MNEFDNFINDTAMTDLPLIGRKYSWYKADGSAMSWLDRFLVTDEWLECWRNLGQWGLERTVSDHCPILLMDKKVDWGPRPFRTLDCWLSHKEFYGFVEKEWSNLEVHGWGAYCLKEKMKKMKQKLKTWNIQVFGDVDDKIESLKSAIKDLDLKSEVNTLFEEEIQDRRNKMGELRQAYHTKESLLHQKSRSKWLKEGDTNSRYFHKCINVRRQSNSINGILVGNRRVEEPNEIKLEVSSHFQHVFGEIWWNRPTLNLSFAQLGSLDNTFLTESFSEEEIKAAVWNCNGSKSPGLDGYNFNFIKKFWDILKEDIFRLIRDFHRNGKIVRGGNPSFIALIPKKHSPQTLNDYRPISLVGSCYKILAKLLAGRLSKVLDKVISREQTAFVGERNIVDSILVANETIDEVKRRKLPSLALKVDFEKAFDSVAWDFLNHMMEKLGFCTQWRTWIMECVQSATISVLVNGSPTREFRPSRGLRQGDPLSPFLFLIVAEGLSGMIRQARDMDLFKGIEVGKNKVEITHTQFADDTMLFCKSNDTNVWALKCILRNFEVVSGLRINFLKSTLYGINVDHNSLSMYASSLHCKTGTLPFLFLGIPIGASSKKLDTWKPMFNKLNARFSGLSGKNISFGGKIVLLNSVFTGIPVYFFSFYRAPKKVLNEIIRIQRRFLWGSSDEHNKICWVKWSTICEKKEMGGLNVKNLEAFNVALLFKWKWRFLQNGTATWKDIIVSKYDTLHPACSVEVRKISKRFSSAWWNELMKVTSSPPNANLLERCLTRKIGSGNTIKFWKDLWAAQDFLCIKFKRLFSLALDKDVYVGEKGYWRGDMWIWTWQWRRELRSREQSILEELLHLIEAFIPSRNAEDRWIWNGDHTGCYSVKSAYKLQMTRPTETSSQAMKLLWSIEVPLKVSSFIWKAIQNKIPTKINLVRRGVALVSADVSCVFCGCGEETTDHIFYQCEKAFLIWMKIYRWFGLVTVLPQNMEKHLQQNLHMYSCAKMNKVGGIIWSYVIWELWKARNIMVFKNEILDMDKIEDQVKASSWVWIKNKVDVFHFSFNDWYRWPRLCIN